MAKTRRYKVGDVVMIPLEDGKSAFGRIFDDATVAIYRCVADTFPGLKHIVSSGILFFAAFFDTAVRSGEWPVVGSVPFADDESSWPPPRYVEDVLNPGSYQLYERGDMRPATEEEVEGLDEFVMYKPEQLKAKIEEVLSAGR